MKQKPKFKFVEWLEEDHRKSLLAIQFNRHVGFDLFATVGHNRITVYKIPEDRGPIKPVLCFADPDENERFYTCAWALDVRSKPNESILLAAGHNGIIRIIGPSNPNSIKYLSGHGDAINDIKVCPTLAALVLSASKDHSLRLWNVNTDVCIAIFGGVEGHRDEVLSCDFHHSGRKIVSCGMDHSLKIWDFDSDLQAAIVASFKYNDYSARKSFPTIRKHFPTFTTRDIHRNYIDCVLWYGNFILSKSCENKIVCWRPGKLEDPTDLSLPSKYTTDSTCTILENFDIKDCGHWFVRFSMDRSFRYLALGNSLGKMYIFDLDSHDHESKLEKIILTQSKCKGIVRQTSFSNNSDILICVLEDGTIWRWDRET